MNEVDTIGINSPLNVIYMTEKNAKHLFHSNKHSAFALPNSKSTKLMHYTNTSHELQKCSNFRYTHRQIKSACGSSRQVLLTPLRRMSYTKTEPENSRTHNRTRF